MTKVNKSAILKGRTLSFEADAKDFGTLPYPILNVSRLHYLCKVNKLGGYNHGSFEINALLTLEDSRDAVPFEKEISLKEEVDFLDKEDDIGEGYIVEGNAIDLDEIAFKIIVSSLPIKVCRPLGKKPKKDEKKEEKTSPFDVLLDLDL